MSPESKPNYDWKQDSNHVKVNISVEYDSVPKNLSLSLAPSSVTLESRGVAGKKVLFSLKLSNKIVASESSWNGLGNKKFELSLKKEEAGVDWQHLEEVEELQTDTQKTEKAVVPDASVAPKAKVVPIKGKGGQSRDWDKIVKEYEEEEEKEEKDVNSLFSKIFAGGDDETKRAMNKSYQESGGTVLSTNWGEVGAKKIVPYGTKEEEDQDTSSDEDTPKA